MTEKKGKDQRLEKLKPLTYRIYGIFSFKESRLIYVDLDFEKISFEFDIEGYDDDDYSIVWFDVVLC